MAKQYMTTLLRKENLASDTWLFAFEKPQGYTFIPGQYQTFTLLLPDGTSDWRDMTITSSPSQDELWLVTKIQESPSPFKQQLFTVSLGSVVSLQGPNGGFTIRDEKRPHVFLAGGIGVNVFHSIMKDIAERKSDIPVTLVASFGLRNEMVFYEELKKLEGTHTRVIYTLTREDWEGETGRISENLLRKYVRDRINPIFMIAGGQDFVDAMNELLLQMGVPAEHIRLDYFTGY